ncbi:MAG: hypothetical protein JO228_15620 [Xanthobacteraceae bacterium]|nr:hypothetical protein [Xanthobacteraceae bacterium]
MTFSVAVAFMAAWLALALMLRQNDSPSAVADREVPAMPTKPPPRVAAPAAVSRALVAASQLLSPKPDPIAPTGSVPAPPDAAPLTPDPPTSPLQLASLPPVPAIAPPETVLAVQPPASGADRLPVGDISASAPKITEDEPAETPEVIPLPPRRPHLAVPLPRPRPQIPEETAHAEPQTLIDFFTGGWR